jgi:hypothetical protein
VAGGSSVEIGEITFGTIGVPVEPGFHFAAETTDLLVNGGSTPVLSYGFSPVVPEPASWILVVTGVPAMLWVRRRSLARRLSKRDAGS